MGQTNAFRAVSCCFLLCVCAFAQAASAPFGAETIVVSDPSDPYHGLAERIAAEENLVLKEDCAQALEDGPMFIILVASPANLAEKRLREIGCLFQKHDTYPGLGIISGSTLESAERLWNRRYERGGRGWYLGTDTDKGQLIEEPAIFALDAGAGGKRGLNKDSLRETLSNARFFFWARHVTENKWFWNSESAVFGDGDKLYASDVPQMRSAIVYTPSCGSFQPWGEDSIALAFVDRGAAAYLGHVRTATTSNAFIMRRGLSVPGLLSWPEFPLGIMAQIQNRMTVHVASSTPLFFMLGDPRLCVQEERPYRIDRDETAGATRTIRGWSDRDGILPVRIEGGAGCAYVNAPGLTSAAQGDPFYNGLLQAMDLGADKYVLFVHGGGGFELQLSRNTPLLHTAVDPLLDVLDYSWVTIGTVNGPFSLFPLALFLAVFLWKVLRRKRGMGEYGRILLVSFLFSGARTAYVLVRAGAFSVSSIILPWSTLDYALGFIGAFACMAGGLMILRDARRFPSRAAGFLLTVMPQLFLTLFYFFAITLTNIAHMRAPQAAGPIWNYVPFWMPFAVLVIECLLVLLLRGLGAKKGRA